MEAGDPVISFGPVHLPFDSAMHFVLLYHPVERDCFVHRLLPATQKNLSLTRSHPTLGIAVPSWSESCSEILSQSCKAVYLIFVMLSFTLCV